MIQVLHGKENGRTSFSFSTRELRAPLSIEILDPLEGSSAVNSSHYSSYANTMDDFQAWVCYLGHPVWTRMDERIFEIAGRRFWIVYFAPLSPPLICSNLVVIGESAKKKSVLKRGSFAK